MDNDKVSSNILNENLKDLEDLEKYVNERVSFTEDKYHMIMLRMTLMYNHIEEIKLQILNHEIDQLLEKFPNDAILLTQKADILRMSGNAKLALKFYRDALSIYPDYENALKGEIIALCQLGDITDALEKAKKIIEKDPSFAEILMNVIFSSKGDISGLNEFFAYLNKLAKSGNSKIQKWLDDLKKVASNPEDVLRKIARAIIINPNSVEAWFFRGTLLSELNRLYDALMCFENVLDMDYLNAEAWWWKGTILIDMKLFKEAERCFLRLTKISPNFADAWIGLGRTYLATNVLNRAFMCFDMATKLNPFSYVAWQFKAYVLGLLGKQSEAQESLKIAKKLIEIFEEENDETSQEENELF